MPSTNNSKLVYHPLPTSEKEIDEHALNYKSPFTYSDMKKSDGYSNFYDTEEHKEEEYVQKQGILLQLLSHFLTAISYVIFFLFLPVTYWICVKKVRDEEKMVIFRLGKMIGAKGRLLFVYLNCFNQKLTTTTGPGRVLFFPWLDRYKVADVSASAFSVPPQQLITNDGGIIEIGV